MQRSIIIIAAASILVLPATALAIPIHVHEKVPVEREVVLHDIVRGDPLVAQAEVQVVGTKVDVIHVAPTDDDEDGVATADDPCPQTAGSDGGCPPPEPVYRSSGTGGGYSGDGTSSTPVDGYAGAGGSTVQCESGGDYYAVDPSGTYWGGWQFDQSTWDAYAPSGEWGSATPAQQDAAAAAVPYDAWPNC